MADGERIAKAYVEIGADLAKADQGLNQLEPKVTKKILEIQQKTNAQLARNKLEMKVAVAQGDFREIDRLHASNEQLKVTLDRVNQAALNQAAALRGLGNAGAEAGRRIQQGGNNAAMGLMMLSQFVDDMQYGFRSVVNNIPSLGMAVGSAIGMGSEAAMKFGGALGIAAVAANLLLTHWDDLMDLMGMGKTLTEAEQMEKLAAATKRTADEQDRLNRYKREESAGKRLSDKQPSGLAKTTTEIDNIIADLGNNQATGFDLLVGGLIKARRAANRGEKILPEEQEKLDNWTKMFGDTPYSRRAIEREQKAIQDRINEEDERNAKKTVEGATFDPLTRKQLINEINRNPAAFPPGAADKLAGIKPSLNAADQKAKDKATKEEEEEAEHEMEAGRMLRERRKAEDSRLANAMMSSVGQKLLKNPEMLDDALIEEVKTAMALAGMKAEEVAEAAAGTAKKIRENMDKAITDRALTLDDHSQEKAREQLLKEAQKKDDKGRAKSEVMSTENYLNKLLTAGLSRKEKDPVEDLAKQQLDVSKNSDKILDKILTEVSKPQKAIPAIVGPGR